MTPDVAKVKRMMRTRDELKAAIEAGDTSPDLQREVEELVKKVRKKRAEHEAIQNRIRRGLATNGKNLRRNATCPCGSQRKFKKCCLSKLKAVKDQGAATLVPAGRGSAGLGGAWQGTDFN